MLKGILSVLKSVAYILSLKPHYPSRNRQGAEKVVMNYKIARLAY